MINTDAVVGEINGFLRIEGYGALASNVDFQDAIAKIIDRNNFTDQKSEITEQMKGQVRDELRQSLRSEVIVELKEVRDELRQSLRSEVIVELKEKLYNQVIDQVRNEARTEALPIAIEALKLSQRSVVFETLCKDVSLIEEIKNELKKELENKPPTRVDTYQTIAYDNFSPKKKSFFAKLFGD